MNEMSIISPKAPDFPEVSLSPEILKERDLLLDQLNQFGAITTDETRDSAIAVVRNVKSVLDQVEKDRVAIKAPFLKIGKAIDEAAKAFKESLELASRRVERGVGAYNQKVAEAQAAEVRRIQEEQKRIAEERQRAELAAAAAARALEEAATKEERIAALKKQLEAEEAIEAKVEEQSKSIASYKPVETAKGGAQRYETTVEVTDIRALYAAHPHCVTLTPKLSVIKAMAENGDDLPGVKVTKTPVFSVRK
jgi:hypothetical protein